MKIKKAASAADKVISADNIRNLSAEDFLELGMDHVVYIRSAEIEGHTSYTIHAADGTTLRVEESFDHAIGSVEATEMNSVLLQ